MEWWQRQAVKSLKSFATCWHDWKCLQSNLKSSYKNNVTCQSGAFWTLVTNWRSPLQASNAITVLLGIQFNFRFTYWMLRKLQTVEEGKVLQHERECLLDLDTQDIDPDQQHRPESLWSVTEKKFSNIVFEFVGCVWE